MKNAMLINYGLCFGCDSCTVSCMKEKGLSFEEQGIVIKQYGPVKVNGSWEWDYIPVPTNLCDLCEERVSQGKPAACHASATAALSFTTRFSVTAAVFGLTLYKV